MTIWAMASTTRAGMAAIPCNGHRAKTVLTDTGPVEISVPRDRDSSFDPKIVAKGSGG